MAFRIPNSHARSKRSIKRKKRHVRLETPSSSTATEPVVVQTYMGLLGETRLCYDAWPEMRERQKEGGFLSETTHPAARRFPAGLDLRQLVKESAGTFEECRVWNANGGICKNHDCLPRDLHLCRPLLSQQTGHYWHDGNNRSRPEGPETQSKCLDPLGNQ